MALRKARTGTAHELNVSVGQHTVVGLRPIKEKNKRSEAMVDEQILFMKETQYVMQKAFENFEKALAENDHQKSEEELECLFKRSEEFLVIIQVLVKIRNELAHGRMDLERAKKSNSMVDKAKRRVKWLQDRLDKVLLTAKSYCYLYNQSFQTRSDSPDFKEQISETLWNKLPVNQQKLLSGSERPSSIGEWHETTAAAPIVKEIEKMVLQNTESLESVSEAMKENKESRQSFTGTKHGQEKTRSAPAGKTVSTGIPSKGRSAPHKRKQRKRSHASTRKQTIFGEEIVTSNAIQKGSLEATSNQSDGESDTTAEPYSDPEDYDDQRSHSIVSSVGEPDMQAGCDVAKRSPVVEVSIPSDDDDDDDIFPNDRNEPEKQGDLVDKVGEYWSSDHHKFEWSEYMQRVDPSSWHALGLVVPESFLSKEKPEFDPSLPWREKPMKVNSVIDVHKIALDKLLLRLHRMYETIGQATQSTIDPLLKDEKIETVMGNLELDVDGGPASETVKQQPRSQSIAAKHVNRVSLPQIVSPGIAAQKSFTSPEVYPATVPHPAVVRTARRNTQKLYPQDSSAWCDSSPGGFRMPQIVKTKDISKKISNIQPRYLPQRKPETPKTQQLSDLDLGNKSVWKPSMVLKIVNALKVFDDYSDSDKEESGMLDHDSPKWKRIETLLSDGGLASSNPTIAAEAAKAISKLQCRDKKVIDTLREVLKKQTDARVCYEASKAMVLLGTWDPYAMAVIRQSMKTGNKDVVLELLSTMTKARNIAFVDKSTAEFKELADLLIFTIKTQSPELAFHAAVSLGRLCVVEPVSRNYLVTRLSELSPRDKGEALYVLIKQMNHKDKQVVEALLQQLSTSYNWKLRMEAADLLIFIGARDVFSVTNVDEVFDTLERLLWDHANNELRGKVSQALGALGLRQRACQLVLRQIREKQFGVLRASDLQSWTKFLETVMKNRRLEDPAEEVRGRAVVSLATLGMKGVKEMKALLDILELDSSIYVRTQVVRAFAHMEWNDPRIFRSLREREKGDGSLAMEAKKTLTFLSKLPGRSTVTE